jgi:hypothetical protein
VCTQSLCARASVSVCSAHAGTGALRPAPGAHQSPSPSSRLESVAVTIHSRTQSRVDLQIPSWHSDNAYRIKWAAGAWFVSPPDRHGGSGMLV